MLPLVVNLAVKCWLLPHAIAPWDRLYKSE